MPQSFAVYLLVSPHFFDGVVQDVRVNLNALVPFELGGLVGHMGVGFFCNFGLDVGLDVLD